MSINSQRDNGNGKSFLWDKRYSYTSYNWDNGIIQDFTEPEHTSTVTIPTLPEALKQQQSQCRAHKCSNAIENW